MIQRIGANVVSPSYLKNVQQSNIQAQQNSVSTPVNTTPAFNYTATQLVNAYQALHGIVPAKTVSFGGLGQKLEDLQSEIVTCRYPQAKIDAETDSKVKEKMKGETVGNRWMVTPLHAMGKGSRMQETETAKIFIDSAKTVSAETTYQKNVDNSSTFKMSVPGQDFSVNWDDARAYNTTVYLMETKGKLSAVVDDRNLGLVLISNNGDIKAVSNMEPTVSVDAKTNKGVTVAPFVAPPKDVDNTKTGPSIGEGTDLVIGMEEGRFVPEIIKSIEDFVEKVNNDEIVLPQFKAAENAQSTQLAMLAGGFGSRAEYTNASSNGILNSEYDPEGAQNTKGTFKTPTGLTPMETTFVSLHKAGLLDCSKGKLKIGDNIKFYLNQSGVNKGNGGFTVDLYDKMAREGRESLVVLPNDSLSRMPKAAAKMAEIMNSGDAAIAMIAKTIPSDVAKGTFGIMKINEETQEIEEFAEKPKEIPEGYEHNGMCFTNTFQFSVSKEAFEALDVLKDEFKYINGKESRDWSKFFVPVLMSLTQSKDAEEAREKLVKSLGHGCAQIDLDLIAKAKDILGDQKIYAVPTDESWADVGSMGEMYKTMMDIAKGTFKLEPFERNNVLDSVNTQTGLVASSKADREKIEAKYNCLGSVMAVPKAEKVDPVIVDKYITDGLVTINPKVVNK